MAISPSPSPSPSPEPSNDAASDSPPDTSNQFRPLRIAFVTEYREDYLAKGWSFEQTAGFDWLADTESIVASIESLGHTVERVGNIEELAKRLALSKVEGKPAEWDLVWNFSEGNSLHEGREAQVPSLLEAYGIPFTFSDAATMALLFNKAKTKMVLDFHGVPTAPYAVVPRYGGISGSEAIARSPHRALMTYPLFAKPSSECNGKGIHDSNKVWDDDELNRLVSSQQQLFPEQDILIEKFLEGRDFTVLVVGTRSEVRVIGVLEQVWTSNIKSGKSPLPPSDSVWSVRNTGNGSEAELVPGIDRTIDTIPTQDIEKEGVSLANVFGYDAKRVQTAHGLPTIYLVKGDMNDPVIQKVADVALRAHRALDCFDCSRTDVRHDVWGEDAVPNFIEINPMPGLKPANSCFAYIAAMNGYTHQQLMGEILESAMERSRHTDHLVVRSNGAKVNGH